MGIFSHQYNRYLPVLSATGTIMLLVLMLACGRGSSEPQNLRPENAGVKDTAFFKKIDSLDDNDSYLLALRTLDSARERFSGNGQQINRFYFLATRAGILARAGYSKSAVSVGNEALQLAGKLNDTLLLAHGYLGLSYTFLMDDYDSSAKKYIDMAEALLPATRNDTALLLRLLNNQAVYEMMVTRNYDRTVALTNRELEIARRTNDPQTRSSAYNNMTGVYYYSQKFDSALMFIDSTIAICRLENNKYKLATAFVNKSSFCLDLKRIATAALYADSAARLFAVLDEQKPELPLLKYMVRKAKGDFPGALAAFEQYDSLNKLVKNNKQVELADLLESEQKVTSIQQQMHTKELEHEANIAGYEKKKRTAIALGAGLLLVLLMLTYIYKSEVNKRKLAQHNLAQAEALLQERTSLLGQMRENTINRSYEVEMKEFREKLSMELHDNVAGALAGMKFKLSMLPPSALTEEIIENIGNIYNKVRGISHGLISYKPTADFPEEIRRLILGYLQGLPVKANLNIENEIQLNQLPNQIKEQIHLIIQEILANVIKHSGATDFNVSVSVHENNVLLNFSDNGRGYEVEKVHDGIGLRNINRRLKEINGMVTVNSSLNRGAQTNIRIPVK
jgi:signal transduction histidine kinase